MTSFDTISFPFETTLSLEPLIAFWAKRAENKEDAIAQLVMEKISATPDLHGPITDISVLDTHHGVLDLMMDALYPLALRERQIAFSFAPFRYEIFYATSQAQALDPMGRGLLETETGPVPISAASTSFIRTIHAYQYVLHTLYDTPMQIVDIFNISVRDEKTGLKRFYKLNVDPTFSGVKINKKLRKLTPEQITQLTEEPFNLDLWQKILPPKYITFEGFVTLTATEITKQQVLSLLKNELLRTEAMTNETQFDLIEERVQTLLDRPSVKMGLIAFKRSDTGQIEDAFPVGRSLLMHNGEMPQCPHRENSVYFHTVKEEVTKVIRDLRTLQDQTGFESCLLGQDLHNLLLMPLKVKGEIIGLLELASPKSGALNEYNTFVLNEVMTLFANALHQHLRQTEDQLQAIIKRNYTAIHESVEWRFRQAAQRYHDQLEKNQWAEIEPVVFKDVYPLYGLSDIRNSSTHRNEAVQADLAEQLSLALAVIVEACIVRPLPVLDEIGFRIEAQITDLNEGLGAGDETKMLEFIHQEIEPLFASLKTFGPSVEKRITAYYEALDETLGVLYNRRKAYERSVTAINDALASYLESRETVAQDMFPHYFERFKTDGVDYNIYVGASLLEKKTFDPLYLHNLRLWQLMTMCGMVWEMQQIKPTLDMPLDTAHLILVHSTPLAIRFRLDEKKFDVDGAYNMRYEIVKKRIDKAYIAGTNERLTQPGRIAIVYTQERDEEEYLRYIHYLQAAGYVEDDVEKVILEELQGVHHMRALRVTVAKEPQDADAFITHGHIADLLPDTTEHTEQPLPVKK